MNHSERCIKPGCGVLKIIGQPCRDGDCPQKFLTSNEYKAIIAENTVLKQRIKEIDKRLEFIENNDVYWNMDDPDETGNSPEEIACNNSLDKEDYMKFGGRKYVKGFIAFKATELDDEGNPCDWESVYYENEEDAASSWRLSVIALQKNKQAIKKHIVKKDETLSSIALKYYGKANMWPIIYLANKDIISNPHKIYPKQVIFIPEKNS